MQTATFDVTVESEWSVYIIVTTLLIQFLDHLQTQPSLSVLMLVYVLQ